MSTIITPSEDQINIVITDDSVNVNVTSEPVVVNVTEEIIQVSPISGAYPLPSTVYSVFGRTGSVVAQEGDYDLSKLSDVVLLDLANNDVLSYNGTNWVNEPMDLSGYVPYTGATSELDLGDFSLLSNGVLTSSVTIDGGPDANGGSLQFIQRAATRAGLNNSTVISAINNNQLNLYFYHDLLGEYTRYKKVNFKTDNLTIDQLRTYYFPDADGTLALLEAPQVFTEINTFANATIFNLEAQFSKGHYLVKGGTPSLFAVGQVNVYSETSTNNVVFRDPSSKAKLVFNNSTQTYTFPAASGTIALTSDLSGYVTLIGVQTLSNKTFSDVVNLGNNGFKIAGITGVNPVQMFMSNSVSTYLFNSNSFGININNDIFYSKDANNRSVLSFNNTSERIYSFPNASGTLALTSDIPSTSTFVPYTGATTNVNLGIRYITTNGITSNAGISLSQSAGAIGVSGYTIINGFSGGIEIRKNTTNILQLYFPDANNNYSFPNATGTIALTSNLASYVPYTGATANVNLGTYSLTANALIKNGGVDTQFLKADGSVDNNVYLTANDLPSTLSLYATTTASAVSGYTKLVTRIDDPDYNTTAVDVSTGTITTTNQFIAALISPANLINGNPGIFNVSTYGNIKKVSGSGEAEFYFEIYKRTSAGVETLVGTSSNTLPVVNSGYSEFFATAIWNDGVFDVTDTIVLKYYASRISGGSDPVYNFQFGGTSPVRTLVPIPIAVIPNIYMADIADVENVAPLNNEILYYNSTSTLWEHSTIAGLLGYTPANDASVVHIAGTETITGFKTFTPSITAASLIARGVYLNPSLTASAANDGLYALDVSPTFSNGAFTGVTNNGIRITTSTNRAFGGLLVSNTSSTGVSTAARMQVSSNTASVQLSSTASSYSTYGMTTASSNLLYASAGALSIISVDSFISLGTGASGATEGLRMFNTSRNIQIKNGGIFADNGFKLEVVGTTRITDILTLGSTISNGTYSYMLPSASGQFALTSDFMFAVPYTGALQNVDLGIYNLTAASLIKSGGTSAQILAADGSVITAGTNITISGGTISSSGGGGSMAIGGTITGATTGSVLFVNSGSTLAQDNTNFFWDDTNNRLGIGTASPLAKADVNGQLWIRTSAGGAISGAGAGLKIEYNTSGDYGNIQAYNYTSGLSKNLLLNSGGGFVGINTGTVGSQFQVNGNAAIGYSASTAAPTNGLAVAGATTIGGDTTISGVLMQTINTNRQAASYSLILSDRGKLVEMNVATANTLTVPLNSSIAFPIGTEINIAQYGAGQTTIVATSGVTIRSTNSWLKINARYGAATLVKIGTDEWYLFGNLNA